MYRSRSSDQLLVFIMFIVVTALPGCARAELTLSYVNDSKVELRAEGSFLSPKTGLEVKTGPGVFVVSQKSTVGAKSYSGLRYIPPQLTIRWRTEAEKRAAAPDAPKFLHEQTIDFESLVDRKTFQGTIWLRWDGESWLAWPQTNEEYEEHRKYTAWPAAPWQCRLVSVPEAQWKLLKEQPWLGRLTIFNPNPKPADAGKLIRKTDNL